MLASRSVVQRLALVLAFVATACAADVSDDVESDEAPPASDAAEVTASPSTLRIMSFNIKNGEIAGHDMAKLVAPLRPSNPDVLALQEVDEGTRRANGLRETSEVAKQLAMPYSFFAKNFAFDGGAYGVGIVSKYPLANARTIRLDDHTTRGNGYEPRIAAVADVEIGARTITVVSVHASLRADERAENARRILDALGAKASRALVMGDFNETPREAIGDRLTSTGFVDSFHEKHPWSLGFTIPATPAPTRRIDFLYKGRSFGATVHAWIPDVKTSDHRPVAAVVTLPR